MGTTDPLRSNMEMLLPRRVGECHYSLARAIRSTPAGYENLNLSNNTADPKETPCPKRKRNKR